MCTVFSGCWRFTTLEDRKRSLKFLFCCRLMGSLCRLWWLLEVNLQQLWRIIRGPKNPVLRPLKGRSLCTMVAVEVYKFRGSWETLNWRLFLMQFMGHTLCTLVVQVLHILKRTYISCLLPLNGISLCFCAMVVEFLQLRRILKEPIIPVFLTLTLLAFQIWIPNRRFLFWGFYLLSGTGTKRSVQTLYKFDPFNRCLACKDVPLHSLCSAIDSTTDFP